MTDRNALPPSWPEPPTDPPDDDPDAPERDDTCQTCGKLFQVSTCGCEVCAQLPAGSCCPADTDPHRCLCSPFGTAEEDGAEFLDDWYKHDCDDGDMWCPPCVACHLATGETVCQFTCEHRKDLE